MLKINQNHLIMKTEKIESDLAEIVIYVLDNNQNLSISEHNRFDRFFSKAIRTIKNNG